MITRVPEQLPLTLAEWAAALHGRLAAADGDARVRGLADDSRQVAAGSLFFARRGADADGLSYARAAMAAGATAVVTDSDTPADLPVLRVADADAALRAAADLFYGSPQDDLTLIGITGTKGKTTTAWLTAAALRAGGLRTAVFGTIAHDLGDGATERSGNTTPGVLEIRRLLARARDGGAHAAVLEVSSHALDQGRVAGLPFRVAVFTNLGRDHLDYHGDAETYRAAKRRLFQGLGRSATALFNSDDPAWWEMKTGCHASILTYGMLPEADFRAVDVTAGADRTSFLLQEAGEEALPLTTALVGEHNVRNVLAAVAAARRVGVRLVEAAGGAAAVARVPGRLERVRCADGSDVDAFVDYAHTPESLRAVLGFLRGVGARPLICVVGCGGDRDRTKRSLMAAAAVELADRVVFTSDNPRTEDPLAILRDMEAGVPEARRAYFVTEPDRRTAIRFAVDDAPSGACVLVAGKGHEDYQINGTEKIRFVDVEEVRAALAARRLAEERSEAGGFSPRLM